MEIDFNQTGNLLSKHNKNYLQRKSKSNFSWGVVEEENIDIIKRGFIFSNPDLVNNCSFEITTEIIKIAKWMTNTMGKGLALIGSSGRGKTMFLHGVLPHLLISKRKAPTCVKAVDLDSSNRSGILLIDEVGREDQVFDKTRGKVDRFPIYVDYCADKGIPLFFTSNLSKEQFINRYDVHIFNRVNSICNTIICNGKSMWS